MSKELRVHWAGNEDGTERIIDNNAIGWTVDTDFGLSVPMMRTVCDYALGVQKDRLKGMAAGPQRDALVKAVSLLEKHRIRQNIAGSGDRVMFDAYKKNEDSPIISFPGWRPQ